VGSIRSKLLNSNKKGNIMSFGNLSDLSFNAEEVAQSSSFDPLPPGDYNVIITKSEIKDTKAGTGQYLSLSMLVFAGEYEGRVIFTNINIKNPNKVAEDIARAQLSSLCHSVGVLAPKDSSDFHDKPFTVALKIRPPKDGYEAANDVKSYKKYDENAPVAPVKQAPFSAPKAPASSPKPWEKAVSK
jgi:hypothetical protein